MATRRCSVEGCGQRHDAHGYCSRHRQQMRYHGRITEAGPRVTSLDLLREAMQQETDDCVEPAFKAHNGYGYKVLWYRGKVRLATHVAMEEWGIPRPEGHEILHSCDNPPCINRRHIRWGTGRENVREAIERGRMVPYFTRRARGDE